MGFSWPPFPLSQPHKWVHRWPTSALQPGFVPITHAEHLLPWQVSKTGKEIKEYIESMAGEDPLLKGVPEDKNPFKEKGGCTIS